MLFGQNGVTVLEKLQAGETLEIDWVQQQYLSDSGSVVGEYPLFPDQMKDGEGEMHAALRLEMMDNKLKIWVESIYCLQFYLKSFDTRNQFTVIPPINSLVLPVIEDTRYFFDEVREIPPAFKNLSRIPLILENGMEISNPDWFNIVEESNKRTPTFFNRYHLTKMVNQLLQRKLPSRENYQFLYQEKRNAKTVVNFFRPNYPPQKTIIQGVIQNYYDSKVFLSDFNQDGILKNWEKYEEVALDSLGRFKFEVDLDKRALLKLNHAYNHIRVYVEPGDSLNVIIDGNAFFRKTKFTGDNAVSNEVLLELFHELRGDTFWIDPGVGIQEKTQAQYFSKIPNKQAKELKFLAQQKNRLSPAFNQFLERHILFWNARLRLKRIYRYYQLKDIGIDQVYIYNTQEIRRLLFRMPEYQTSWILGDYLKFHYLFLKGRYFRQSLLSREFQLFNLGKLLFITPDNLFRLGDLNLFNNYQKKLDKEFLAFYAKMETACHLPSHKKLLSSYLDKSVSAPPERFYYYFPLYKKVPKWHFSLTPSKSISLQDYQGDYLLLHIGLAKNLKAAKSDILGINANLNKSIKTLSIVVTRDSTQIGKFQDEVIYISPNEMRSLRDSFYITNNANYFYLIDPEGKVITSPYNVNSYKKLFSTIIGLPTFKDEETWQPTPTFWRNLGITALLLLLMGGVYAQRKRILAKREQQKRQLVELELKGIRAQMNPHFLFNALSSIQNLIRKKEDVAADRYLTQFAGLVRKILRNSEQEFITLEEEMAAIKQYCSLEALRTPFDYELNIAEDIDAFNTYIPGMLIQPLVENAILHGLMPQLEVRNLWINIKPHPKGLACEIIDNGIGIQKAKGQKQRHKAHQKSFGMTLIRQRLGLLLNQPEATFLTIQDRSELTPPATGTIVNLIIPIEQ